MEFQPSQLNEATYVRTRYQPVWAFILLSFTSFGLYTVYWFYENWRQIRDREDWDIYPVWRALFAIFFTHALLCYIDERAVEKGHPGSHPNWLATGYILVALTYNISARMLPGQAYLLFLLIAPFWFLIPAVRQLNFIASQEAPGSQILTFRRGELIVLIIGGLIHFFAIFGLLFS